MHKAVEHASFGWQDSKATCAHAYLSPKLLQLITELSAGKSLRILDLGCGNGYVASRLAELGHRVMGVDISPDGIEIAHRFYPSVDFRVMSIYDEHLPDAVGEVDCVISFEVVEHLFYPQRLFEQSWRSLRRGGAPNCFNTLPRLFEESGNLVGERVG